jgi:hypothetical protein
MSRWDRLSDDDSEFVLVENWDEELKERAVN